MISDRSTPTKVRGNRLEVSGLRLRRAGGLRQAGKAKVKAEVDLGKGDILLF
jgi:hypothetical protein